MLHSVVVAFWTGDVMRILVVEDEPGIARFVRPGPSEAGYAVDVARDGNAGLDDALAAVYDMIVLDILLPGMAGLTLLKRLRHHGSTVPILLLTMRDGVDDRITGFDNGADDYLTKPFAFGEMLSRRRAACDPLGVL